MSKFIVIVIVLGVGYLTLGFVTYYCNMRKDKYDLLNFIKKNKKKLSVTMIENESVILDYRADKEVPLASTVKIIIAYHFVKKVTAGDLMLAETVNLREINQYYIEGTDGGAHPNWLKMLKDKNKVTLLEVAKGMMHFSSNACTDFLIDKIGVDIINKGFENLELGHHDPIYPLTAGMLLPAYLADSKREAIRKISELSHSTYVKLCDEVFDIIKHHPIKKEILKEKLIKNNMLNFKIQSLLTERLPASTTNAYARLMINLKEKFLDEEERALFNKILLGETVKHHSDQYFWYKGGSTPFVLTSALYKENENESISISLFISDKKAEDTYWISNVFNDFMISLANDREFREKFKRMIISDTGIDVFKE